LAVYFGGSRTETDTLDTLKHTAPVVVSKLNRTSDHPRASRDGFVSPGTFHREVSLPDESKLILSKGKCVAIFVEFKILLLALRSISASLARRILE